MKNKTIAQLTEENAEYLKIISDLYDRLAEQEEEFDRRVKRVGWIGLIVVTNFIIVWCACLYFFTR